MQKILVLLIVINFVSSNVNAQQIPSSEVFTFVEQMPEFPGGDKAMMDFISSNIKYPELAKENGVMGKVYVKFIVKADGNISDIVLLKGIGSGCDEEVLRVINLMPQWKPGKQNGVAVNVVYTLPVSFYLYSDDDLLPGFIGGDEAWMNFLKENSNIKLAVDDLISNDEILTFTVDTNGKSSDLKLQQSQGNELDNEAIRIFNMIEKWNVGTKNGKPAKCTAILHFPFKL